jgi:hypothetical protein
MHYARCFFPAAFPALTRSPAIGCRGFVVVLVMHVMQVYARPSARRRSANTACICFANSCLVPARRAAANSMRDGGQLFIGRRRPKAELCGGLLEDCRPRLSCRSFFGLAIPPTVIEGAAGDHPAGPTSGDRRLSVSPDSQAGSCGSTPTRTIQRPASSAPRPVRSSVCEGGNALGCYFGSAAGFSVKWGTSVNRS